MGEESRKPPNCINHKPSVLSGPRTEGRGCEENGLGTLEEKAMLGLATLGSACPLGAVSVSRSSLDEKEGVAYLATLA